MRSAVQEHRLSFTCAEETVTRIVVTIIRTTAQREQEPRAEHMTSLVTAVQSGHWPSLLGAWLHFEVSFMIWLLIGALGVSISDDFGLTATQKGFLVAVPLLGGALLRIVVGLCSDQYGAKNT